MSFNPAKYIEKNNIQVMDWSSNQRQEGVSMTELKELQNHMFEKQFGKELGEDDEIKGKMLEMAPIHFGNSPVGDDLSALFEQGGWRELFLWKDVLFSYSVARLALLLVVHLGSRNCFGSG